MKIPLLFCEEDKYIVAAAECIAWDKYNARWWSDKRFTDILKADLDIGDVFVFDSLDEARAFMAQCLKDCLPPTVGDEVKAPDIYTSKVRKGVIASITKHITYKDFTGGDDTLEWNGDYVVGLYQGDDFQGNALLSQCVKV